MKERRTMARSLNIILALISLSIYVSNTMLILYYVYIFVLKC